MKKIGVVGRIKERKNVKIKGEGKTGRKRDTQVSMKEK